MLCLNREKEIRSILSDYLDVNVAATLWIVLRKEIDILGTTWGICPFSIVLASHFKSGSAHMIGRVLTQLY